LEPYQPDDGSFYASRNLLQ